MWQQLKRPILVTRWGAGNSVAANGPDLPALWRYLDVWYLASADVTSSTILDAVELARETEGPRLVGVNADSQFDLGDTHEAMAPDSQFDLGDTHQAMAPRQQTFQMACVGRLVWRRFLSELIACARQERLEISYETDPHVFSVGLTVTVYGVSTGVARFEGTLERLLVLYHTPSFE